jgi:general stress protein 26
VAAAVPHAPATFGHVNERDDDEAVASSRRGRLFDLTSRFRAGNLVTRSADGLLRARPMTVALLDASSEEIGFLTSSDAAVVQDVAQDPMVNVVFQDGRHHVAWSGRAQIDSERYRIARAWQPELARWFPDGPDDPRLVMLVVRAIRAEYWSASVVARAWRALGGANGTPTDAELDPMRHGVVLFGDDGAITEW